MFTFKNSIVMKNNITYLLGAGASANAVPTVFNMMERIYVFSQFMQNELKIYPRTEWFDLIEAKFMVFPFKTPDTYAKKLFLTDKSEQKINYKSFKLFLTLYLIFEQFPFLFDTTLLEENYINNMKTLNNILNKTQLKKSFKDNYSPVLFNDIDSRYYSFWATIIDNDVSIELGENINIISWNYDQQLEFSYSKFENSSKFKLLKNLNKVNGTAKIIDSKGKTLIDIEVIRTMKKSDVANLFKNVLENPANYETEIKFAWEKTDEEIEKLRDILFLTDVIVIIGYSFPDFNRYIDRILLSKIEPSKIVYVQDPNAINIIERLKGVNDNFVNGVNVFPYDKDLTNFLIPKEYWEDKTFKFSP